MTSAPASPASPATRPSTTPLDTTRPATTRIVPVATSGLTRHGESRLAPDTAAMAWRSVLTMVRKPAEFFDVLIQPVLFTVMYSQLFGGAVAGDVSAYLPLIVPGLVAINALTTTQSSGVDLREDMDKGVFDRFRSLPMSRIAPVLGPALADLTRYVTCSAITLLTGMLLGYRPVNGWTGVAGAVLMATCCAWAFSWVFMWMGTVFPSAQSVTAFAMIVGFPLTFLSNALVPTDSLPGWLAAFVRNNPISHVVSASRYLLDGAGGDSTDVLAAVLGSLAVLAVAAPLTIRRYQRRS